MSSFLSPADLALELGCAHDTVLRAIKRGHLSAFKYGRLVRIRREEADRFIASHTTSAEKGRRLRSTA